MKYLNIDENIDGELDERKSQADFLMSHIYPKLPEEKKKELQEYFDKGIAVLGAFEMAGVKITCWR